MTWQYIGTGPLSTVANGSITLTEPSGVEVGDLLIACFSIRGSVTVDAPVGWTQAVSRTTGNTTVNGTGSVVGGRTFWAVKQPGSASASFPRIGGDLCMGRIIAYRGNNRFNPIDAVGNNILGTASPNLTLPELITTEANDLIVAVALGARNVAFSTFASAGFGSNSGTNPPSNNPLSSTQWQERSDDGTTVGADGALAIADILKTTSGGTGIISATASASARHGLFAMAFKQAVDTSLTANSIATPNPVIPNLSLSFADALQGINIVATSAIINLAPQFKQVHSLATVDIELGVLVKQLILQINHGIDGSQIIAPIALINSIQNFTQAHSLQGAAISSSQPIIDSLIIGSSVVLQFQSVTLQSPMIGALSSGLVNYQLNAKQSSNQILDLTEVIQKLNTIIGLVV